MSASFARHSSHVIKAEEVDEDDVGKALPESGIGQLDDYMDLLGQSATHGKMTPEQVQAMARAVHELLRDTGRRPYEITELRTDCPRTRPWRMAVDLGQPQGKASEPAPGA
jgi:hypothetical protein